MHPETQTLTLALTLLFTLPETFAKDWRKNKHTTEGSLMTQINSTLLVHSLQQLAAGLIINSDIDHSLSSTQTFTLTTRAQILDLKRYGMVAQANQDAQNVLELLAA